MAVLNSKKRNKVRRKHIKRAGARTQPSFRKRNKKTIKRKLKGSFKMFFWRIISSFKISFVLIIAFVSFVGFGIYWIIQNKYFQIKDYELVGNQIVDEDLLLSSVIDSDGKFIFFISPSQLESQIRTSSNYIKSVYVEKKLPDKISIHIEEREPVAVWRTVNGAYLIDKEGYVLEKTFNDAFTLELVLSEIYSDNEDIEEEDLSSEEVFSVEEISEEDLEDGSDTENENDEELIIEDILDPELLAQIDMEQKSRGNEQSLLSLDFDLYNKIPDSFKKYPQVKILSDQKYEIDEIIDSNIWSEYSELLTQLKDETSFDVVEVLIFSESKVLVLLESEKKIYFRLDEDINQQIRVLEFIYGRLIVESIDFQEIDLRFKRPVIRN